MKNADLLLIAGPDGSDDELVALAATFNPRRVTVIVEADDPNWGWSEQRAAAARRDRLAALLTAVERATGASVVGLVGAASDLDVHAFGAIVSDAPERTAA